MHNKIKILLPSEQSATSEDVDVFLTVDLQQEFTEMRKERFDNDFDLSAQFVRERNASRNFIIYGTLTSTAVDCVDLPIKVYSDSDRAQEIATITPTSISYNQNNVFGKKNGKYFIKLENYQHDRVYFRIESDNFSYRDQDWEQQLVFSDADGNYVPYGTKTVDVNSDGNVVTIENDFPFFFNKHWIRLDKDMIEEKVAKVSFNVGIQTLSEGQSGELMISLDKPSPFGLEMLRLNMVDNSSSSNSYAGSFFSIANTPVVASVGPQDPILSQYEGRISIILQLPSERSGLIAAGSELTILNGSYVGVHTILYSRSIVLEPYTDIYQVVLDVEYDQSGTNSLMSLFRIGSQPDITFTMNQQPIAFPMDLFWQVDEVEKVIQFTINNDFEAEFTEFVDLKLTDLLRCDEGDILQSRVILKDSTPRNYVSLFFGPTYENRVLFTGRTYIGNSVSQINNTASHSILRNGYRFEGRSEEFYPNMGYTLKITNSGNRTIFPVNQDIGVAAETIFDIGETKEFYLFTKYLNEQKHSIRLKFISASGQISGINSEFAQAHDGQPYWLKINGLNLNTFFITTGYNAFKIAINESQYNVYDLFRIDRPFDVSFDDQNLSVTLTSKSPGVKLEFSSNDETITATTISPFFEKGQREYNIVLLANSDENTNASYTFSFENNGFRKLTLPRTQLLGSSNPIPYYLVTAYSDIMRPYHDDLQQPYYGTGSTIDGLYFYQVDGTYPTQMKRGNAMINGIAFLAENTIYGSKENLTNYGLGEGQFLSGFLPERISPLPGTFEPIATQSSSKVIDLKIPYSSAYAEPYIRSFEFKFGNAGSEVSYTLGGTSYLLRNNVQWWWTNNIPSTDGDVAMPIATLQQRLDTGVDESGGGPVYGQVVDSNTLRLVSKASGINFSIDNIMNYPNSSESMNISRNEIVPHVVEGDVNPANNGMGGFSI